MTLDELATLRARGQRPIARLLTIRDRMTRSNGNSRDYEIIVRPGDEKRDWRPLHGLVVHVWLSTWDRWVLHLFDAMAAVRPQCLTVRDPVSSDLIVIAAQFEDGVFMRRPLAIDYDNREAWLARKKRDLAGMLA